MKQIYLLGEEASWIESRASELSIQDTKVTFALDKFHAGQAIQRISKDNQSREFQNRYSHRKARLTAIDKKTIDVVLWP